MVTPGGTFVELVLWERLCHLLWKAGVDVSERVGEGVMFLRRIMEFWRGVSLSLMAVIVSVGLVTVPVGSLAALELDAESGCAVSTAAAAIDVSSDFAVALFSRDVDMAAPMRFEESISSLPGWGI